MQLPCTLTPCKSFESVLAVCLLPTTVNNPPSCSASHPPDANRCHVDLAPLLQNSLPWQQVALATAWSSGLWRGMVQTPLFNAMQDLQKRYVTVQRHATDVNAENLVTLAHSVHKGLGVVATVQQWAETSQAVGKNSMVCNSPNLMLSASTWNPQHSKANGTRIS